MLLYYSFMIGASGSKRSTWKLEDCKIAAIDPKSAIMLHFFLKQYEIRVRTPWMSNKFRYLEPSPLVVDYEYRAVIEWQKIHRKSYGHTLVQYKKLREISQHQFITLFKGKSFADIK